VVVGEDENVENINFALARGGVITGKVTDADGRPVIQQQVFIFLAADFEQRRGEQLSPQLFAVGGAPTDDRGIYRVFGLMPGRYKVAAGRSENTFSGSISTGRLNYTQVFHPDATDQHGGFGKIELPLRRKFRCLSLEPENRHCWPSPRPATGTRQGARPRARDRHDMPELDGPGKWLGEQETAGLQCRHQHEA